MSRIPPCLLYLTIYNPTLSLAPDAYTGDEDAEEQAQILFYTARERAVSRDRMLRQVGLAKALVNFSEAFDPDQACENVHSQTRRMVMISPEPDFWIHACVEVAKTPRSAAPKGKSKKGKAKKTDNVTPQDVVEYHDASVHDVLLRAHLLQGYEEFKLTHGSFANILFTLGQQALELQLERFFTVWAWKWDIEEDTDFASYLGVHLHPLSRQLSSILDTFTTSELGDACAFVLAPPYVIPSTKFSASRYPTSLVRYILSRIPPIPCSETTALPVLTDATATSSTIRASNSGPQSPISSPPYNEGSSVIPEVPSGSVSTLMPNMSMDIRNLRWNWWTFGKESPKPAAASAASSSAVGSLTTSVGEDASPKAPGSRKAEQAGEKSSLIDVDAESLREAISTEYLRTPSIRSHSPLTLSEPFPHSTPEISESATQSENTIPSLLADQPEAVLPSLLSTTIYLGDPANSTVIEKKRVWHLTVRAYSVVLIAMAYGAFPCRRSLMARDKKRRYDHVLSCLSTDMRPRRTLDTSLPTATKILQPKDRHIIGKNGFLLFSSPDCVMKSAHLYNAQQFNGDIVEVFSRGQNPQHWHVAKRGLAQGGEDDMSDAEAYMEISRKESTLTDVDNELAAIVRRCYASIRES
ncbi:hypothetical protein POSPLADRAFT_1137094 [Postia placenta MAD-698-R-SB12]|uniref:CCZ1/INTU/HSP4 first Longin domain-containing protein n=1 Tax=Postia placenta MAD-698-R-SB12 TaxID=670580 RepID=A0A1X6N6V3_9APHY|nr:hypothetical protein POSPLADRAFT_1137094 [Postia placenta MAD-698-R-SB12]OSX64212.1 hypothetical protein POSPLADRAFT_1137094 [Postia placenta MAD-698-R-SB12]